ncbi:MAG: sigma-54 dependent transcriptional regulator [Myxococcota bacterium]|nr:sigma-54 dependent transcriptional regulator [Myxococcota bacterium]
MTDTAPSLPDSTAQNSGSVLVVDDDPKIVELFERVLARSGLTIRTTRDPERGLEILKANEIDVLVTDLRMPRMTGLELLHRARTIKPNCDVILMTGNASVETAREALKHGAADYLTKPFSVNRELLPLIQRLLECDVAHEPAPDVPATPAPNDAEGTTLIGESKLLLECVERASLVAPSVAPVLILGESGTGKELIADWIHRSSRRADAPFVKVNCASLTESLLESELFGHVRGAFTGAVRDRKGLFEVADGGTLFLDEVGELSASMQPKLLRVLQEGTFTRVGDHGTSIRVDVRIVTATHRDLLAAIAAKTFRDDLYYRLNVIPLVLPPLRDRREDVPVLARHFLGRFDTKGQKHLSESALEALVQHDWPGNVRELENAIQHGVVLSEADEIGIHNLPAAIQADRAVVPGRSDAPRTLEEIEQECIVAALRRTGSNRTAAARVLGVTRRTLGYRIAKYGLDAEFGSDESQN